LRIAVVTTSWPSDEHDPSGHFVRSEARALARAGHDLVVLAPSPASSGADGLRVLTMAGGAAFGWPGLAARLRRAPWRGAGAARFALGAARALRGMERAGALDRVVAHWWPCGWPVAGLTRVPLDVVSHGADVRLLVAMAGRDALARRVAARATSWRFVSSALRDSLLAALGADARRAVARIAVVGAAAVDLPMPAQRAWGGAPFYTVVGRLVPGKRVDRALAHIAAKGPASRVVVVGDGPERLRLEARAQALGLEARFVGRVPRPEALGWMAASRALVFASVAEGRSTVLREARALGVPVEHALALE